MQTDQNNPDIEIRPAHISTYVHILLLKEQLRETVQPFQPSLVELSREEKPKEAACSAANISSTNKQLIGFSSLGSYLARKDHHDPQNSPAPTLHPSLLSRLSLLLFSYTDFHLYTHFQSLLVNQRKPTLENTSVSHKWGVSRWSHHYLHH